MKEPACVQFVNRAYMFAEPLRNSQTAKFENCSWKMNFEIKLRSFGCCGKDNALFGKS